MDLKNLASNSDLVTKAVKAVKSADIDTKKVADATHVGEDKVKAAVKAVKSLDDDTIKKAASILGGKK